MIATIPASYLSIAKNFGIGFLCGVVAITSFYYVAYLMATINLVHEAYTTLYQNIEYANIFMTQLHECITEFQAFFNQTPVWLVVSSTGMSPYVHNDVIVPTSVMGQFSGDFDLIVEGINEI